MRKIALILVMSAFVFAQNSAIQHYSDPYIPSTDYAGTLMSARTLSTSYDDTTKSITTRGYADVFVGLETAANDSGRVLVAYAPSKDGVTFDAFVALDSLVTTGTVGKIKYIRLPDNAMGAYAVKVRLYGDANVDKYSANPSTTLTTRIIKVPYNLQKIK